MSSKTKIVVLHMKEIIYTVLFICLGILLVALLTFMFHPKTKKLPHQRALPINRASTLHSLLWAIKSWK